MAVDYQKILNKYLPKGVKVRYKRGPKLKPAWADIRTADMLIPKPVSLEALAYAIHECGHYHKRHFSSKECPKNRPDLRRYTGRIAKTLAQQEHEAEHYTIRVFRREGLPVQHHIRGDMKNYVAECIDHDTLKNMSPKYVRDWIK